MIAGAIRPLNLLPVALRRPRWHVDTGGEILSSVPVASVGDSASVCGASVTAEARPSVTAEARHS
jgi:hypothetical protein